MTDWAVVIECTSPGQPPLDLTVIDRLVEHLSQWRATALYNPDRYALQVVVDSDDPRSALGSASQVHNEAIRTLDMPRWPIVRIEAMTLAELARSWEVLVPNPSLLPKRVWEICPSFTVRMYEIGRLLVRATTIEELSGLLVRFVHESGGWTPEPDQDRHKLLPIDLSLGTGAPVLLAAEPMSSGRLLLEDALPTLVEDAKLLANRLHRLASQASSQEAASRHPPAS